MGLPLISPPRDPSSLGSAVIWLREVSWAATKKESATLSMGYLLFSDKPSMLSLLSRTSSVPSE